MRSSGAGLAHRFYDEAVLPILRRDLPGVRHAAGRLGSGSDVLGLDDATSQDHDWGCRLTVLVADDAAGVTAEIRDRLEACLPEAFLGQPVRFATSFEPRPGHQVEVATVRAFTRDRLGVDPLGELAPVDWLVLTGQSVLEVVAGPVFADQGSGLTAVRERLAWYPDDVWRYVLAAGWRRLSQELPFVGRTAERGDDLGSRVLAARLGRDLMHLTFLLERRWPPYPKWFGIAFAGLRLGETIGPHVARALAAPTWREREESLVAAAVQLHRRQRDLGLSDVAEAVGPFWDRPYRTVRDEVAASLLAPVDDPAVLSLPPGVGSIEQWVDNVDVLSHPGRRRAAQHAYTAMLVRRGGQPADGTSAEDRTPEGPAPVLSNDRAP